MIECGVHPEPMGTNLVAADDGLINQLRHIEELNLGPVLTEKQKATKARLAEVDDLLQEETTLLRKLQNVMREKESRVSKARSKAASMKEDLRATPSRTHSTLRGVSVKRNCKMLSGSGRCCVRNKTSERRRYASIVRSNKKSSTSWLRRLTSSP
jgi:chromosome segregation ATPase